MSKTLIIGIFENGDKYPLRPRHFGSTSSERMLKEDGRVTTDALQSIVSTVTRLEGKAPHGVVIMYVVDGFLTGEDHFTKTSEAESSDYRRSDNIDYNNRYQTGT